MRIAPLALALLLTLGAASPALAQQAPPIRVDDTATPLAAQLPDAARLARFDAFVADVQKKFDVPGVAVAIVKDGRLVLARGYGFAEVETNERYQPDSLCRSGSNAKTITAATAVKLAEGGRLSLDAPVLGLLRLDPPSYPGATFDTRWTNVTARQALYHTAGWNNETASNPLGKAGFEPGSWPDAISQDLSLSASPTPVDMVRWMLGKPLQYKPGTEFHYSDFGFDLVSVAIARVEGRPYEQVARQVLSKAGITRMWVGRNGRSGRRSGEVVYYLHPSMIPANSWAALFEPKPFNFDLPYAYPIDLYAAGGGWILSAIDLARLVAAIDGDPAYPDILTTNSVSAMLTRAESPSTTGMDYIGMGWDTVRPSSRVWYKAGGDFGNIDFAIKYTRGVIVAFTANTTFVSGILSDQTFWTPLAQTLDGISPSRWLTHDLFPATLSYDAWRASHFSEGELANSTLSGDEADPDGDGVPNLLEYASGTDPRALSAAAQLSARAQRLGDQTEWLLTYHRLLLAHEVDYSVETSDDLQSWTAFTGEADEPALNLDGTVATQIRVDPATNARFFRLRVTRKPQ